MVTSTGPGAEPTVAQASPARWRAWLLYLVTYGKARLAALGLTLGLGLGAAVLALYLFAVLADTVMDEETIRSTTASWGRCARFSRRGWIAWRSSSRCSAPRCWPS